MPSKKRVKTRNIDDRMRKMQWKIIIKSGCLEVSSASIIGERASGISFASLSFLFFWFSPLQKDVEDKHHSFMAEQENSRH